MRLLVFGLVALELLMATSATPASAQSEAREVVVPEVGVMTTAQVEERIAELEKAYNSVKLAGPRAGVGISSILVAGGLTMIIMGAAVTSLDRTFFCPPEMRRCRGAGAGGPALITTGLLAFAGGTAGLVVGSNRLRERKKKRRRIAGRINTLERALPEPKEGS